MFLDKAWGNGAVSKQAPKVLDILLDKGKGLHSRGEDIFQETLHDHQKITFLDNLRPISDSGKLDELGEFVILQTRVFEDRKQCTIEVVTDHVFVRGFHAGVENNDSLGEVTGKPHLFSFGDLIDGVEDVLDTGKLLGVCGLGFFIPGEERFGHQLLSPVIDADVEPRHFFIIDNRDVSLDLGVGFK